MQNNSDSQQSSLQGLTLEQYRSQREYRQAKRKEYLRKFQFLKQKLSLPSSSSTGAVEKSIKVISSKNSSNNSNIKSQQVSNTTKSKIKQNQIDSQQAQLLKQNQALRQQLKNAQDQQRKKLNNFKDEINVIKQKYMTQIKKLHQIAKTNKANYQSKLIKVEEQIRGAAKKNDQIEIVNKQLQIDVQQSQQMINKYSQEIKKEYAGKLDEFQKIFASSNQKIEAMQKQFNQDEFIETTLKNEQLVKGIQQSCQKGEQTANLLKDYETLLAGKNQILGQIQKNNKMKQGQILKMSELQGKLRAIFEKLNEEKKSYMMQNTRMAEQLMQVKALLTGGLNSEQKQ